MLPTTPALAPPAPLVGWVILLALILIPGHILWRILLARHPGLRAYVEEHFGFWCGLILSAVTGIIWTGWIAFLLGEAGLFRLWLLIVLPLAGALLLAAFARLRPAHLLPLRRELTLSMAIRRFRVDRHEALQRSGDPWTRLAAGIRTVLNSLIFRCEWIHLPALLLIATLTMLHPMEPLWRSHKAGLSVACGLMLAKHGGFRTTHAFVSDLAAVEDTLRHSSAKDKAPRLLPDDLFSGAFRIVDKDQGKVYPAFFHYDSAWLGLTHSLLGVRHFLVITPLFGIISVAMVFLFFRAISSAKVALLAALLLALNHAMVYFARLGSSVIFAELAIFAGFTYGYLAACTRCRSLPLLSGLAFGAAILCGNTLLPYLVAAWVLAFLFGRDPRSEEALGRVVYLSLIFGLVSTLVLDLFTDYGYAPIRGAFLRGVAPWITTSIIVLAALVPALSALMHRPTAAASRWVETRFRGWSAVASRFAGPIAVLVFAVTFVARNRPYLIAPDGSIVFHQKWFYWYLDELGFAFLLVGLVFFFYFRFLKKQQHEVFFPFLLFFIFFAKNSWNPGSSSLLLWEFRKFVPIFLPFGTFFAAYALFAIREVSRTLALGALLRGLSTAAGIILVAVTARELRIFRPAPEPPVKITLDRRELGVLRLRAVGGKPMRGLRNRYAAIAESFPPGAILLSDASPGLRESQVPVFLSSLHGIDGFELDTPLNEIDPERLRHIVTTLTDRGRAVFLLQPDEGRPPESVFAAGLLPGPPNTVAIGAPHVEEKYTGRPKRTVVGEPTRITFYRVEPAAPAPDNESPDATPPAAPVTPPPPGASPEDPSGPR